MKRLPLLPKSTDMGLIYVVQRGQAYKIGFTRKSPSRRVRACDGVLVLTIPTGQQPGSLERAIHLHFAHKRVQGPGFKREWFALDESDLDWLKNFATTTSSAHSWSNPDTTDGRKSTPISDSLVVTNLLIYK